MAIPKSVHMLLSGVAGAVVAAYAQTVTGWWLNSGKGVSLTATVLFVLALFFGSWGTSPWPRAVSLWIGAMVGLTASLFWTGPGSIWPIVLGITSGITAVVVLFGTGLGMLLHRATQGRR